MSFAQELGPIVVQDVGQCKVARLATKVCVTTFYLRIYDLTGDQVLHLQEIEVKSNTGLTIWPAEYDFVGTSANGNTFPNG